MKKTTKTFSVINRRYCFSEFITQNIRTPSTKVRRVLKCNHVPKYKTSIPKVRSLNNLMTSIFSQNIRNLQWEKDLTKLKEQEDTTDSRFRGVLTIHSLHSVRRWRTSALIWNTHRVYVTAHHVIKSFVMSVCPIMQRLGTAILTALCRSDTQPYGYNTLFSLASPRPEHCQYYDRRERPGATSGDHSNTNHTISIAVFRDVSSCILVDGH
jgi:hypothetical protein